MSAAAPTELATTEVEKTGAGHELEVLHHDEALIAVAKPSGMLVHRGWGRDDVVAMTLARDLAGAWVYPVHRLDRGTSGVLLFALSSEVARTLQASFVAGEVAKRYLVLVRGVPPEAGIIDHPLAKRPGGEKRPAVTEYRRLGVFERYALVEARPRTGRLHQIRRHFKHISHHVIGDVRYGKGEHNRLFRARFGLHRLALHALELACPHPTKGDRLHVAAPVPEDLAGPLAAMGLPLPELAAS